MDAARMFAVLPGVAAVGLALLYAVGAVEWVAEVNGERLAPGRVMPLVPLEQVLARGVSTVALAGAVGLVVAPIVGWVLRWEEQRPEDGKRPLDLRTRKGRAGFVLIEVALAGLGFMIFPPVIWIGLVALLVWLAVRAWRGRRLELPYRRLLAVAAAVALFLLLAQTLFDPEPLPRVRVTLEKAPELRGRLITSTGETWYVVVDDERVVGVPAARVIRGRFEAKRGEPSSIFGDIFGTEPLRPDDCGVLGRLC